MKRITIFFGGTFGIYLNTIREIESKLHCRIRRISAHKLSTKIKDVKIDIILCIGPTRDKNYYYQKKYLQTWWKEVVPPPADEAVKKAKGSDVILFFGYCGTFHGRKSVYTPEKFREIFFETNDATEADKSKLKVKNPVKIKNILKGNLNTSPATVITSNVTLAPVHSKPESKDNLIHIAEILSKSGDVVEKESYQIAKYFRKKSPLGIYLQSSDVLTNKRHMLAGKMEMDKAKFNNNVVKSIKFALKKIKED